MGIPISCILFKKSVQRSILPAKLSEYPGMLAQAEHPIIRSLSPLETAAVDPEKRQSRHDTSITSEATGCT